MLRAKTHRREKGKVYKSDPGGSSYPVANGQLVGEGSTRRDEEGMLEGHAETSGGSRGWKTNAGQ